LILLMHGATMSKISNVTMLNNDLRATCSRDHLGISAESQHMCGSTQGFNLSTSERSYIHSTWTEFPYTGQKKILHFYANRQTDLL